MKTIWTWATANPFLATITGVAIIGGIIWLITYFTKDDDEAPEAPANPNPERVQAGSLLHFPTTAVVTGTPAGMGSGNMGGVGIAGGRAFIR